MDKRLIEKMEIIIKQNCDPSYFTTDAIKAAREIAAMLDAEAKPDTIPLPEAVERLVGYFTEFECWCEVDNTSWTLKLFHADRNIIIPDWIRAIFKGNSTPAAVHEGLEKLFITILEKDDEL
jgi:hypothetical protein